jgi:glucose-1-phosphate thymidylyltransferase
VYAFEKRYGQKIACPEEIAFKKGFISAEQLESLGNKLKNSLYGQYLLNLLD